MYEQIISLLKYSIGEIYVAFERKCIRFRVNMCLLSHSHYKSTINSKICLWIVSIVEEFFYITEINSTYV